MWCKVACLVLVLAVTQGWEFGKRYEYLFGNQIFQDGRPTKVIASGIFQFKWDSQHLLTGRFRPKYVGDRISHTDSLIVPKDSFQVVFKAGQVTELKVSEDTKAWQVEFIRGMLGLLQVSDQFKEKESFSIVEESVAGKCKTHYNVTKQEDSASLMVVKTKDYTNCEKTPVFERGIYGSNYDALMKKRDIMARNTKAGILINGNYEIEEALLKEDITLTSENSTIVFSTTTGIWMDDDEIETIRETVDDNDFMVENLISVGSLMYHPKPQKSFCHKQMGLHRNEIESSCEADYYMNPKQFETAYNGKEISIAKTLVEQIAEELKTPSEVPKTNTLDRFTVLVGVVRYMSARQLEEVANFYPDGVTEAIILQSAIVQAGTLEALQAIRYIKENKQFASDLIDIGVLPEKVHPLTLEYLDALFEFSTDKELMENDFTFASDLFLAFSNLLRRYSTEQEKPFKQEQLDKLILKKYRKFLSEKLQTAVNNNEELKYQVYVRALGNMADLSLFNYFWASNADKLTPFQKTMMVNSMDNVVNMYPEKSRVLLMKIYKNSRETWSTRVAAAFQLFKTDLPEATVLDIIQIAKDSNDGHIKNAVKSTVLAENYKYNMNEKIYEMAQTIEITEDESTANAGNKFSESRFQDISDKLQKEFFITDMIRGMDENPLSIFGSGQTDRKGFKSYYKLGGMIDNFRTYIRGFSSFIYMSFYDKIPGSSANIEIDKDFSQMFIPFVNLKSSPLVLMEFFQEDKLITSRMLEIFDEVVIGFPTESGLPFMYTYQAPIFKDFEMATHVGDTFKVDMNLILSYREQTKMGFANPMTGKHYVHGIDVNRQLNIPLSVSYTAVKSTYIVTIDPLFREGKQRLVHLGTWPYTGVRDLFPQEPVAEDEDTVNIQAENLFRGELASCESKRFLMKVVSSEIDPSGDVEDYFDGAEIERYAYAGPFGEVKPTHNLFNIFFQDIPNHPTSLTFKIDMSESKFVVSNQMEDAGKIRGPFFFMGRTFFKGEVEFTGPTNYSATMEISRSNDLITNTVKVGWEGSYSENDTKVYEACLDTYMRGKKSPTLYRMIGSREDENESKMDIFTKLRVGETCKDGMFVSGETEVDMKDLEEKSDINLNVTVDFGGLPDEIGREICLFEGDTYPGKETMAINFKIIQKNPEKCEALLRNTDDNPLINTDNTLDNPDADVEVIDMIATE